MVIKRVLVLIFGLLAEVGVYGETIFQDTTGVPNDWFLRDPEIDHVQGVSAERVYSTLLSGRPSHSVLVAVIDSGIEIEHEDLKDVIWVNNYEIPENGIDDDKNGYIDDVHGWNFIGGKSGNVDQDTYELTREFVRLRKKYETPDEKKPGKKNKVEYEYWRKIKDRYEKYSAPYRKQYDFYNTIYKNVSFGNDTLKRLLGLKKLTPIALESLKTGSQAVMAAKSSVSFIFQNVGADADIDEILEEIREEVEELNSVVNYGYNTEYDSRKMVGDDYSNPYERYYGNNDIAGGDSSHGTHVAGIIGANRKNNFGIKGIADNVQIMAIRVVPPNGDERDKDIANGILYAVENGAKIINMSFGKSYSPEKEAVDKAVKYAESKGVLLIHAAGNEGDNIDQEENYPNRIFNGGKEAKNWLEIGASSWGADDNLVASFSNYGKKSVDLFAPGVKMYSSAPQNSYNELDGTSFSSPATTGVAAILLAYFPELSAHQVKDILCQSVRKFEGLKVRKPGSQDKVEFSQLSNSGGLVNAYEAVELALKLVGERRTE